MRTAMEQQTKRKFVLATGILLASLVIPVWVISPVFGILAIAIIAPILFISSKHFSIIGKSIVAGAYVLVVGFFLQAWLISHGIFWGDELVTDRDVVISKIVLTSSKGKKINIPLENFSEIRKRAGLAKSSIWVTNWIKLRGTPWVELFELYVDAQDTQDYRFVFKENDAIKGEIIAYLYLEAPKGYKTEESPDYLNGVYYVNELSEFIKTFDKEG